MQHFGPSWHVMEGASYIKKWWGWWWRWRWILKSSCSFWSQRLCDLSIFFIFTLPLRLINFYYDFMLIVLAGSSSCFSQTAPWTRELLQGILQNPWNPEHLTRRRETLDRFCRTGGCRWFTAGSLRACDRRCVGGRFHRVHGSFTGTCRRQEWLRSV